MKVVDYIFLDYWFLVLPAGALIVPIGMLVIAVIDSCMRKENND